MLHPTPSPERARNSGWTVISHCEFLFFLFKDWRSRWFEVARKTLPHTGCITVIHEHIWQGDWSPFEGLYGGVFVFVFFFFSSLKGPCVRNSLDESAIFRAKQRGGLSKKQNDIRQTKLVQIDSGGDHSGAGQRSNVFIDEVWPQSGSFFVLFCHFYPSLESRKDPEGSQSLVRASWR